MRWPGGVVLGVMLAAATVASAQLPSYGLGRRPTADEIRTQDFTVGPAGKELPPGSGTAKQGAPVYEQRCASCHGMGNTKQTRTDGRYPVLTGPRARLVAYPFATTIWDFINSAMSRRSPDKGVHGYVLDGKVPPLTANEVYALTAYILAGNQIIQETDVLDAKTLPLVKMPKRDPHLDKVVAR